MEAIFLVIRRHAVLAIGVFLFALIAIMLVHVFSPRVYEVQTSFYIQRQIPNQYQEHDYDDMMDHIRILKSDLVLDRIIAKLKKDFPKRKGIDHELLLKRLRADSSISGSESGPTTKVVDLKFQDTDPKFAKKVLDYTLEAYERALEHIAQETRLKGLVFLKKRLAEVQRERQQMEQSLQKLEAISGTTDIEVKNSELVKLKSNFAQMLGTANAEINATEQQISHLRKILGLSPTDVRRLASMRTDTKLENWQKQLAVEKGELARLKAVYTENHPSVLEKEDAVQRLEMLIDQRIRAGFGQDAKTLSANFSEMDATLGKQLIDLTTQRAALLQQKAYYEQYLAQLSNGFEEVSFQKMDMGNIRIALSALQSEEEKLQEKIQDTTLEQASLLNLGSFVVLSPPVLPDKEDAVFPMSLKMTIVLGLAASLLLAVFSIGIAEFLDPRIILFERPGTVLGEFNKKRTQTPEDIYGELNQIYQNIALLARKGDLKVITFLDLFGSLNPKNSLPVYQEEGDGKPQLFDYWTPGGYAPALAGLFAQKHLKILLVSCGGLNSREASLFNPFRNKGLVYDLGEAQLYRSHTQENLFLLVGRGPGENVLDPYLLEKIQEFQLFDLVLVHRVLPPEQDGSGLSAARQQAKLAQVQALSDSLILGISKAGSNVRQLQEVQRMARQEQVLGSIVFP
jgi:uncharacterized protein involved in exopolysaccharide biosynthesis